MNLPKNKTLVIFDFDETLCKTNGLIRREKRIEKDAFTIDFMTAGEYSNWRETGEYDLNPTIWDLNFDEFTGYPKKGIVINKTFNILKKYVSSKNHVVSIVTGRDELAGPKKFLLDNNIDTNKMIFLCSGDPNKKPCYESLINTLEPSSIIIYEDAMPYINQCKEVAIKYKIGFSSFLIEQDKVIALK